MKKIPLTQGKFALVDDEDYEYLSKIKWYVDPSGYVANKTKNVIFMHRLVAKTPKGKSTDHINGNKLDNQKKNLRTCTTSQNMANRGKQVNNTSGYKGVFWSKAAGKWRAQIRHKNKSIHLGLFETKKDAAKAYNKKAKELWGCFAQLNKI